MLRFVVEFQSYQDKNIQPIKKINFIDALVYREEDEQYIFLDNKNNTIKFSKKYYKVKEL